MKGHGSSQSLVQQFVAFESLTMSPEYAAKLFAAFPLSSRTQSNHRCLSLWMQEGLEVLARDVADSTYVSLP